MAVPTAAQLTAQGYEKTISNGKTIYEKTGEYTHVRGGRRTAPVSFVQKRYTFSDGQVVGETYDTRLTEKQPDPLLETYSPFMSERIVYQNGQMVEHKGWEDTPGLSAGLRTIDYGAQQRIPLDRPGAKRIVHKPGEEPRVVEVMPKKPTEEVIQVIGERGKPTIYTISGKKYYKTPEGERVPLTTKVTTKRAEPSSYIVEYKGKKYPTPTKDYLPLAYRRDVAFQEAMYTSITGKQIQAAETRQDLLLLGEPRKPTPTTLEAVRTDIAKISPTYTLYQKKQLMKSAAQSEFEKQIRAIEKPKYPEAVFFEGKVPKMEIKGEYFEPMKISYEEALVYKGELERRESYEYKKELEWGVKEKKALQLGVVGIPAYLGYKYLKGISRTFYEIRTKPVQEAVIYGGLYAASRAAPIITGITMAGLVSASVVSKVRVSGEPFGAVAETAGEVSPYLAVGLTPRRAKTGIKETKVEVKAKEELTKRHRQVIKDYGKYLTEAEYKLVSEKGLPYKPTLGLIESMEKIMKERKRYLKGMLPKLEVKAKPKEQKRLKIIEGKKGEWLAKEMTEKEYNKYLRKTQRETITERITKQITTERLGVKVPEVLKTPLLRLRLGKEFYARKITTAFKIPKGIAQQRVTQFLSDVSEPVTTRIKTKALQYRLSREYYTGRYKRLKVGLEVKAFRLKEKARVTAKLPYGIAMIQAARLYGRIGALKKTPAYYIKTKALQARLTIRDYRTELKKLGLSLKVAKYIFMKRTKLGLRQPFGIAQMKVSALYKGITTRPIGFLKTKRLKLRLEKQYYTTLAKRKVLKLKLAKEYYGLYYKTRIEAVARQKMFDITTAMKAPFKPIVGLAKTKRLQYRLSKEYYTGKYQRLKLKFEVKKFRLKERIRVTSKLPYGLVSLKAGKIYEKVKKPITEYTKTKRLQYGLTRKYYATKLKRIGFDVGLAKEIAGIKIRMKVGKIISPVQYAIKTKGLQYKLGMEYYKKQAKITKILVGYKVKERLKRISPLERAKKVIGEVERVEERPIKPSVDRIFKSIEQRKRQRLEGLRKEIRKVSIRKPKAGVPFSPDTLISTVKGIRERRMKMKPVIEFKEPKKPKPKTREKEIQTREGTQILIMKEPKMKRLKQFQRQSQRQELISKQKLVRIPKTQVRTLAIVLQQEQQKLQETIYPIAKQKAFVGALYKHIPMIKTDVKAKQLQETITAQEPITIQEPRKIPVFVPRMISRAIPKATPKQVPRQILDLKIPPEETPKIIIPKFPKVTPPEEGKKRIKKVGKRKYAYTPNLISLEAGLIAKVGKPLRRFAPTEIRPIPKKFEKQYKKLVAIGR